MRSGVFQGVWEQIIYVYWPHRARSRALLTGPEADVHFGEVAGERFSGIIEISERRGHCRIEEASDKENSCGNVWKWTHYLVQYLYTHTHRHTLVHICT